MQIDWRPLLDTIRVPWADTGKNTSKGHVNIRCPWCFDDPSHHLTISEDKAAYYCYRDPLRHSGRNLITLLVQLGVTRADAVRLLNVYKRAGAAEYVEEVPVETHVLKTRWDRFQPINMQSRYLDYLYSRGFDDPETAAVRYDLRYASEGKWAGRLLIPFREDGFVRGWTGRALRDECAPKYLTEDVHDAGLVFAPRARKSTDHTLLIVEGPIDALKIDVSVDFYYTVALTGKALPDSRVLRLQKFAYGLQNAFLWMDGDVPKSYIMRMQSELASALKLRYLPRPDGVKDPGAMQSQEIAEWLAFHSKVMYQRGV